MSLLNWSSLRSVIEGNQSFLISSHVRPDADALGSELGMAAILESFGKTVTIVNATAPPANMKFLNADGRILKLGDQIAVSDVPDVDVHVIVDTSAWQQLGAMADVIQKAGKKRVVIDHHVSSDNMGATEFKSTVAAATGELIFEASQFLGVEFDAATASALYSAIATDTGWFRFPSTTAQTMSTAAELIKQGAVPSELYQLIHEQRSVERVKLGGRILERVEVDCDGRLAWISVDHSDFSATGAVQSDTEGLVNECLKIGGTEAAFIAVQLPSGHTKFSLRCRQPHNVATLAESFSGGGHKLASGATVRKPLAEALPLVLEKYREMLSKDSEASQDAASRV